MNDVTTFFGKVLWLSYYFSFLEDSFNPFSFSAFHADAKIWKQSNCLVVA